MENWLSIAAGVYLLSMVLCGHYRGIYPACSIYGGIGGGAGNCARIHAESNRILKRKYVDTADAV